MRHLSGGYEDRTQAHARAYPEVIEVRCGSCGNEYPSACTSCAMRPWGRASTTWPWHNSYDRRKRQSNFPNAIPTEGPERVAMLARAGALIAAEIDRLNRAAVRSGEEET